MDARVLYRVFEENRDKLLEYIRKIKRKSPPDLFSAINPTLILNPYASRFPLHFFQQSGASEPRSLLFVKAAAGFYLKNFYKLLIYTLTLLLYRLFSIKRRLPTAPLAFDLFFLVNPILEKQRIEENYFAGLYEVLEKHGSDYTFLVRLYGLRHNPFAIISLLKVFRRDARKFIFEFDLLRLSDLLKIGGYILLYPFKTLRLLQREQSNLDRLFNTELLSDIRNGSFESLVRARFAARIAQHGGIRTIYTWHEFQAPDRSFAYVLKKSDPKIRLIACQLYLNYPTYLNSIVDDLDVQLGTAPDRVMVNGRHYLQKRENIPYEVGPSLRYGKLFSWDRQTPLQRHDTLVLGSHSPQETRLLLKNAAALHRPLIYKNHPTLPPELIEPYLSEMFTLSDGNVYELFAHSNILITGASGTAVEAVACGLSVIIVASQENLTANPLVETGKGKVWEIVFSEDEVETVYNHLLEFRRTHPEEIAAIAQWYREAFFHEPSEENIVKAFHLEKELRA